MADGIVTIPLVGQPMACQTGPSDERGVRAVVGPFLAGPENDLLETAVRGVLDRSVARYNPLVLYGPSGTGKSHLARGLLAAWRDHFPGQAVVYTTAIEFARELADAMETQAIVDLRNRYRMASLLVFEDVGRLSDKASAQAELIHTLDAVLSEGGQVVVTAPVPPLELRGLAPALQSRLSAGLTVSLSPPSAGTRLAILQQLAALREIELAEPVAQALADGLNGTVPELLGALVQLEVPARMNDAPIDAAAVRHYLADRNKQCQPQLSDIAMATARYFALKMADLRGASRRRPVVMARDVAMYLARNLMQMSLTQIGLYFGGRDHTTVMHSIRKTEGLLKTDPLVRRAVEAITTEITIIIEVFVGGCVDNLSLARWSFVGRRVVIDRRRQRLIKPTAYRRVPDSRSTASKQVVPRKVTEADKELSVSFQEVMRIAGAPIDTQRPRITTTDVLKFQKDTEEQRRPNLQSRVGRAKRAPPEKGSSRSVGLASLGPPYKKKKSPTSRSER